MIFLVLGVFARAYGGISDDYIHTAEAFPSGFILAGGTWSWGSGLNDILVIKTDPYGSGEWAAVYGGSGTDEAEAIVATTDGGYILAGLTSSYGSGSADMLVLKLTSTGAISWSRVIGGVQNDEAYGIAQVADGGYVVTGRSWVSGEGYNLLFFRVNTDGTLGWLRTFGGTVDDYGYWVAPTSDGGSVITGGTRSYGAGQDDAAVLLLNSSGLRTWFRVVGGSGIDIGQCVIQTSDGGFVVAGRTNSWGAGGYDFFVFKLRSDGQLVWARTIGGSSDDYAFSVTETQDAGFIVAGETWSFTSGQNEALAVKLSSSGDMVWARTFGGSENDYARAAMETPDDYLAFAGATSSFGLESGLYTFLITLSPEGEYPACVAECSPTVTNVAPSVSSPTLYANTTLTNSSPTVNYSAIGPNQADLCPPVGETEAWKDRGPITCRLVPRGLIFRSNESVNLSIYAADGRLVYIGQLKEGENRISLNRGVYIWMAGPYQGRSVVR